MFKDIGAAAARASLRKSMEALRDKIGSRPAIDQSCTPIILAISTSLQVLTANWITKDIGDCKVPEDYIPGKVLRDFNNYFFSGNFQSNHTDVLAQAMAYLENEKLLNILSLFVYYHKKFQPPEVYKKERNIIREFIRVLFDQLEIAGESKPTPSEFEEETKNRLAKNWGIDNSYQDSFRFNPMAIQDFFNDINQDKENYKWTMRMRRGQYKPLINL